MFKSGCIILQLAIQDEELGQKALELNSKIIYFIISKLLPQSNYKILEFQNYGTQLGICCFTQTVSQGITVREIKIL